MKFMLNLNKHIRVYPEQMWYCVDVDHGCHNNCLQQTWRSYNEKEEMELQIPGRSLFVFLEQRASQNRTVGTIFLN